MVWTLTTRKTAQRVMPGLLNRPRPCAEHIGGRSARLAALLQSCLSNFLGNLSVLEQGESSEAIHQMRVAIRRLRSAFGFARGGASPEFDRLRAE